MPFKAQSLWYIVKNNHTMGIFDITIAGNNVKVEQEADDSFIVELPGGTVFLIRKQDNEGATHWFEEGADNETDFTKELGIAIETELMKQA